MIDKTYKFKLRLTKSQERRMFQWIGTCRYVYNLALETKINAYRSNHVSLGKYDLIKQLPALKDVDWIVDVPSVSLQEVIERLDGSYQSFFKGGGFPKWAKKDKYRSITFKVIKQDTHNRVIIPKMGSVKYFNSQPIKGELRRATITKEPTGYFISILTRQEESDLPLISCESQAEIGIDMGIAFFLVTSNGEYVDNPRFLKNQLRSLRLAQRSLSRKVKGSDNYNKQKLVLKKLHTKIRNQRKDFIDKISTQLIKENKLIAIEKLNIQGMIKSNLSQSISDVAWGMFFDSLDYKSKWYNRELIRVNPAYTSQTCQVCGCVSRDNRVTQSKFKCTKCDFESNADENGANNILARARASVLERNAAA